MNSTQNDWLRDARNHASHADSVVSRNAEATRDAIGRVETKLDALIATLQDLTGAISGPVDDDVPQPRTEAAG